MARSFRIVLLAVVTTIMVTYGSAKATNGTTARQSIASDGTEANDLSGGAFSYQPSPLSGDGRYVAFATLASNLAADLNGSWDVYVRDTGTASTILVSVAEDGSGTADGRSVNPAISAGGRFVAFVSSASNLVANDTNSCPPVFGTPSCPDIFVRDLDSGTTSLVSVGSDGNQTQHPSGFSPPAVTPDGRFVAFESSASEFAPGDTGGSSNVFLRDRELGITSLVSVNWQGTGPGDARSNNPAISADGRYVAFASKASDLVPDDEACDGCDNIFVRDMLTGQTEQIDLSHDGSPPTGGGTGVHSIGPVSISEDGRFVAFDSTYANLVAGDTNNWTDVFVRDRQENLTTIASVDVNGTPITGGLGMISGNGRFVTFVTFWPVDFGPPAGWVETLIHDLVSGVTRRVNLSSAGLRSNAHATMPAISGDGRHVSFISPATNLVPGDTNLCEWDGFPGELEPCIDVFVHSLADSDGDGEWDPFDFDTDTDSDSFADPVESRCGSDPHNPASRPELDAGIFDDDMDGEINEPLPDGAGAFDCDGDGQAPDNCPQVRNPDQADADGDLAGDACEAPGSGNVDCDLAVNAVDALKILRFSAALSVTQDEPCLDIGAGPLASGWAQGDVDCSGVVDSVDALLILRANAKLAMTLPAGCPEVRPP